MRRTDASRPPGIDRRMRRRCTRLADSLHVRTPFDLDDLVGQVATLRRRPIHLVPMAGGFGTDVCGAWLQCETEDFIFVDALAGNFHREHIVLHELAHMLFGHRSEEAEIRPGDFASLLPDLDVSTVRRVLARSNYEDGSEQEAEFLASVIRGRSLAVPPPLTSSARQELGPGRRSGRPAAQRSGQRSELHPRA